jgi:hypothetical protein
MYFPASGKHARVTSVLSQERTPSCLCPIAPLASCLEKSLFSSILSEISEGGLLLNEQFGFRSGGSMTLHVAPLTGTVNRNFNENTLTGKVFLDACC